MAGFYFLTEPADRIQVEEDRLSFATVAAQLLCASIDGIFGGSSSCKEFLQVIIILHSLFSLKHLTVVIMY